MFHSIADKFSEVELDMREVKNIGQRNHLVYGSRMKSSLIRDLEIVRTNTVAR